MANFSFNITAGASQSTSLPLLPGNEIHEVVFSEAIAEDIQGVSDPSKVFKVINIIFKNDQGMFKHTVWEPRDEDFERRKTEFTGKDGKISTIENPSNVESMLLLFKHIIDVVNPTISKQIDNGEKNLGAKDWDGMRKLVCDIMNVGKDTPTKIKLLTNKKGEACFPGFFSTLKAEGPSIKNNFVGDKLGFTAYETGRIKNEATSKPTKTNELSKFSVSDASDDLDFDSAELDNL